MLERHPEVIDHAVVDGAAVLPLWGGWGDRLVELGTTAVSPIINTRAVGAILGLVGWRELSSAFRSTSPRAFRLAYREGFSAPVSKALLEAPCPTLLVAGGKEATVRASNAALATLMPHATAHFVPGLGHAWFAWRRELHHRVVEAWLAGLDLPSELVSEPPSTSAVARVLDRMRREEPDADHRPGWQPRQGRDPASHRDLVECPPVAALTTVMADGYPQTSVVWCDFVGECVRANTMRGFAKERNMRCDPRVTLLCYDPRQPLRYLEVRGTVVEMTEDGAGHHLDELASKYSGRPIRYFGDGIPARFAETEIPVLCRIRPTHVFALDATAPRGAR